MPQEATPKPRSRIKAVLIAVAAVICLAIAAVRILDVPDDQKSRFLAEVRQTAVSDCENDPECLENIRLHFDDCVKGNYTSERAGFFSTTYTLDAMGLYDCLNAFQQPK